MRLLLAIAALVALQQSARAARPLTLDEAIAIALGAEPLVAEAHIAVDRAKLAVLRAQLDRFSVKVDASLNELWSKVNILGPPLAVCNIAGTTLPIDQATCVQMGGTVGD